MAQLSHYQIAVSKQNYLVPLIRCHFLQKLYMSMFFDLFVCFFVFVEAFIEG